MVFLKKIAKDIIRDFNNIKGWNTNRKIIVIESDDWGSIRMPSKEVYDLFLKNGFSVDRSDYNRLDSLESNRDLENLFEVLSKYKDKNGNHPIFTANTIVANPDFDKIEKLKYSQYFYESIEHTFQSYPKSDQALKLYLQGDNDHVFHPQFHGREHLNVNRWMARLQNKDANVHFSFKHKMTYSGKDDYSFMEAFDWDSTHEIEHQSLILDEGLNLFESLFGFRSKSFISPCYVWDSRIEEALSKMGVDYFQGLRKQSTPTGQNDKYATINHFIGEKNDFGQRYLVRNCVFEPSCIPKSDWVGYTLATISSAFRWNKPATISTHRINYMGSLNEGNRDSNLELLSELLRNIVVKWPDVEFMTSDQLGDLIANQKNV